MRGDVILEVRDLRKIWPARGRNGPVHAVQGLSFRVVEGTCFGLLGPNGAGKSTVIEIIEDVVRPTGGEVLYRGAPRGPRFRQEVGIQFQRTELPVSLTVRETLELFATLTEDPARPRPREHLDTLIARCRIEDVLERDNARISGGQRQRLLLAMALVNDPALVFLDEPTTGLDPQARRHLWELLEGLKAEGRTLVLTTHSMQEAQDLCDQLVIMDEGRALLEGAPDELLATHGARDLEELFLRKTGKELRA